MAELLRAPPARVRQRPAGYPIADDLPGTPEVLLAEGERVDAFERRVAIVGTRGNAPWAG
jgi:hypothetical protein